MAEETLGKPLKPMTAHDAREVARMFPIPGDINSGRIPTNMIPVPESKPAVAPPAPPDDKK